MARPCIREIDLTGIKMAGERLRHLQCSELILLCLLRNTNVVRRLYSKFRLSSGPRQAR
jgi:hypothetical protein